MILFKSPGVVATVHEWLLATDAHAREQERVALRDTGSAREERRYFSKLLGECVELVRPFAPPLSIPFDARVRTLSPADIVLKQLGVRDAQSATAKEVLKRHCTRVLEACNGNKSLAARVIGVTRKTLSRWIENQY